MRLRTYLTRVVTTLAASLALSTFALAAEEAVPHAQKAPPGPALSPAEAMAKMDLPKGFKVECVAAEPLIVNPTAFTWDDKGRVWVTESVEYPRLSAGEGQDRVKVLEDTDGDGVLDKSTIFADGLNIPCGVVCSDKGVYVTNAPDILYFEDRDGDLKADHREVVLTGFGRADTHELPNTLTWGADGWLYGMNGVFNPATIKDPASGKVYDFTCAIWRYHPPTKRFELYAEGTSNPWGLDYNRAGEWFITCCVIEHLFHVTQSGYYHRQGGPYPPNVQMAKLPSIATDRHQQAAYAGLCIYDADQFPEEFRGRLLMGNLHGSAINQDVVTPNGSTYRQSNVKGDEPAAVKGSLGDGKGNLDFMQANDVWFMPVAQKVGPDGSLYVMDWYDRYHCYQDAKRDSPGIDRLKGRLYRISYGSAAPPKATDLSAAKSDELIELLGHPNVWYRRQAQRLLSERNDLRQFSGLDRLKETALNPGSAKNNASMHALWLLVSQAWKPAEASPIDDAFLAKLLGHDDPTTRSWGVRAIGEAGRATPAHLSTLAKMAEKDPSPAVRVQAVIAAARLKGVDSLPILTSALRNSENAKDPLLPNITYLNLLPLVEKRGNEVLSAVSAVPGVEAAFGQTTVRWIKQAVATSGGGAAALAKQAFDELQKAEPTRAAELLSTLSDGLAELPVEAKAKAVSKQMRAVVVKLAASKDPAVRLPAVKVALWWQDKAAIAAAKQIISDAKAPPEVRTDLTRTLSMNKTTGMTEPLAALAGDDNAPMRLRQVAIDALGASGTAADAKAVIKLYAKLPADLKPGAINGLVSNLSGAKVLTNALTDKTIPLTDVTTNHARSILALGQTTMADEFTAVWGNVRTDRDPQRVEVVEKYRKVVEGGKGDAKAGWAVFDTRCAVCHTIYGKGGAVGPDLTGVGRDDLTAILTSVLDPNLVIGKPYLVNVARTADGDVISGLLVEESPSRVVLKDQTKTTTIERKDLLKLTVQDVSMMPEGLEQQMTEQEFRDLTAFLLTRESPK